MWRALTVRSAATAQSHEDPRLRGRTYSIPFEDVWNAAHALASVGQRGWRVVASDDEEGVIRAEAVSLFRRKTDDVVIRVGLDRDGQTRVDASATAREGRGDWGRNARRLRRFFRSLDRAVVDAYRERLESRRRPRGPASAASARPS